MDFAATIREGYGFVGGFEDLLASREGRALQRTIAGVLFGMLRKRL